MPKRLSIVMSVHNKAHYIDNLLYAIKNQEPSAELVLVDDGSTDGTSDILKKHADIFIRTEDIWEVRANNEGLKQCSGDYVAIVQDDDLPLKKSWLQTSSKLMEQRNVGILGCRGYGAIYCTQPVGSCNPPTQKYIPFTLGIKKVLISKFHTIHDINIFRINFQGNRFICPNTIFDVDATIRSPFIIDRKVIKAIGYLDEKYAPLGYDDHAYCMTAKSNGFRVGAVKFPIHNNYGGGSADLYRDEIKIALFKESFRKNIKQFAESFLDNFHSGMPRYLKTY